MTLVAKLQNAHDPKIKFINVSQIIKDTFSLIIEDIQLKNTK
jgi:hypothetical protein